MHAQLTTFILAENSRDQARQSASKLDRTAREQPGFNCIICYFDERTNEFGTLCVWESQDAAESAGKTLVRSAEEAFGDTLNDQAQNHFVETLEP